jgi:hypothetical protein
VIKGRFNPLSPIIDGLLVFPRLGSDPVSATFLLDTGAMFSVVHPKDIKALGLEVMVAFEGCEAVRGRGIGGQARYFKDEVRLTFEHADGVPIDYSFAMQIAVPTDDNADYPSFLGMDFLMNFRVLIHHERGIVELR